MTIPRWVPLIVGALIIVFGIYRIAISRRTPEQEALAQKRKGLYAMASRSHFLIGLLYLLMGAYLVAAGMGYRVFDLL